MKVRDGMRGWKGWNDDDFVSLRKFSNIWGSGCFRQFSGNPPEFEIFCRKKVTLLASKAVMRQPLSLPTNPDVPPSAFLDLGNYVCSYDLLCVGAWEVMDVSRYNKLWGFSWRSLAVGSTGKKQIASEKDSLSGKCAIAQVMVKELCILFLSLHLSIFYRPSNWDASAIQPLDINTLLE